MLKFCMTIDCERFTSFSQGNPEWGFWGKFKFFINKRLRNIRYNEKGFEIFYKTILDEKFPCTFMLVGKLFRPIEEKEFIEWGYHTYNHLPLNLIREEKLKEEVRNILHCKSITGPMWRIEDIRNPDRIFKELKNHGYENTVYHGVCNKNKTVYTKRVVPPEMRYGIRCFWVSNYFEGNWSKKRMRNIEKDILRNIHSEGVYLLTTHDFTHKNTENLKRIIWFVRKLEEEGKLKIIKMGDYDG